MKYLPDTYCANCGKPALVIYNRVPVCESCVNPFRAFADVDAACEKWLIKKGLPVNSGGFRELISCAIRK